MAIAKRRNRRPESMASGALKVQEPSIDLQPAAKAAVRAGSITLARHGEPALSRRIKLDAAGYRRWWALYEEGGLLQGQTPPEHLTATAQSVDVIVASTRRRSIETAQAVAKGRAFAQDPLFIEAPLPPPNWPGFMRFSPRAWGVIARFWWWFFNHHSGEETRAQAQVRAEEAARQLAAMAESGQDVLVLAHGFFNTMVGLELKELGWRCVRDQGFKYWSTRRFERN